MKGYKAYKECGISWMGKLPAHWEIKPFKYLAKLILDKSRPADGDVKISPENVESNTGICLNLFAEYPGDGVAFGPGDILINKLRIYLKKALNPDYKGFSMGEMLVFRPKDNTVGRYLFYLLFHQGLIDFWDCLATGVKLPRVAPGDIINTKTPLPPVVEQHQIVSFLDRKTPQIDSLMQKLQEKIELLREYRTALINQVVTKGLDPGVEMKDSGVEWIGEIPQNWSIRRTSTMGTFSKGRGISKDQVKDNGFPCIRYGEIYTSFNRIVYFTQSFIEEETIIDSQLICKGDMLFTGSGETKEDIGKAILYWSDVDGYAGGDIIILKTNDSISPLYASYLFNSHQVNHQKASMGKGEIVVHIYPKNIREILIPLPPLNVQEQIVEFLDGKTSQIDTTIEKETRKIELLKEYRQSLISDVVTGKIDVRTQPTHELYREEI